MPLKPRKNENKQEYISRCIKHEVGLGKSKEQAAAICYKRWGEAWQVSNAS
jgi:hypothetical protein